MNEPTQFTRRFRFGFLVLIGLLFSAFSVNAEVDPLKKPKVWSKLMSNPDDSTFWAQYIGKPWVCMSSGELSSIMTWRLSLGASSGGSNLANNVSANSKSLQKDNVAWGSSVTTEAELSMLRDESDRVEKVKYLQDLKTIILEEPVHLSELKGNISQNFVIIEEEYKEEFEELEITYVSYNKKHPEGRYSKDLWIEEKYNELKLLKEKKFEQMKAQYYSSK